MRFSVPSPGLTTSDGLLSVIEESERYLKMQAAAALLAALYLPNQNYVRTTHTQQ